MSGSPSRKRIANVARPGLAQPFSRYTLPPALASEAELMAELHARTGFPLAHWIAALAPLAGTDDPGPRLRRLLMERGLTGNLAGWIAHRAASPLDLPDPEARVDAAFAGSASRWRALHERLLNLAFALGPDVTAIPVSGAVHFRRRQVFAASHPLRLGLGVDFRLPPETSCAVRLSPEASARSRVPMTHRLVVTGPESMQGDFLSWLTAAYQYAN